MFVLRPEVLINGHFSAIFKLEFLLIRRAFNRIIFEKFGNSVRSRVRKLHAFEEIVKISAHPVHNSIRNLSPIHVGQYSENWPTGWECLVGNIDVQEWPGAQQGRLEQTVPQLMVASNIVRSVWFDVNGFLELDKSRIIFVRGPQHYVQTLNSRHGLIERAAVVHVRFQASHVQNGSFLHSHLESAFTAFVPDLDLLLVDICL